MVTVDEMTIRTARPSDIHRVVRLLPQGLTHPATTRYLIAEESGASQILGAAYFRLAPAPSGTLLASLRVGISSDLPSTEAARVLLAACVGLARDSGAHAAIYDSMVASGSPEESLLLDGGFSSLQTLIDFELSCSVALQALDRTMENLKRRRRIPPAAEVISLEEAPITPVNALLSRYLGGALDGQAGCVRSDISTVARVGPRIVGITVSVDQPGGAYVPYTVAEPGYRNGWVTPAMWQRTIRALVVAQHEYLNYSTNSDQFKAMANFTRRMGSRETGRHVRYGRSL